MNSKNLPSVESTTLIILLALLGVSAAYLTLGSVRWELVNPLWISTYDDMFDHARMYRAYASISQFFNYLISGHNEHRILTTRVLSFVDDHYFHGREYTQVVATNIMQILSACLVWNVMTRQDRETHVAVKIALFFGVLLFFINPNLISILFSPFNAQYAIMVFLCVIAATVVANASGASLGSTRQELRVIGALLILAFVATYTLGNAPVILISAAAMSFILRWRYRLAITLATLAIVHTILMLVTSKATGVPSDNPFRIMQFVLFFLGAPFIRFDAWPANYVTWAASPMLAQVCGAVVLLIAVGFAVARFVRPGLGGSSAALGLTLLIVVLVTAVAGGHARAQFGVLEGAAKKYAAVSSLGWAGVAAICEGLRREWYGKSQESQGWLTVALLVILIPFSVAGWNRELRIWEKWREQNVETSLALFIRANDVEALRILGDNSDDINVYLDRAEEYNTGVFSYFPFRYGDSVEPILSLRHETTCRAAVDALVPVSKDQLATVFRADGLVARFTGWTWIESDHEPARTVIAVNSDNRIVGVARTIKSSGIVEQWLGQKFNEDVGFSGFVRDKQLSGLNFYALSNSGSYCKLGAEHSVR